MVDSVSTRRLRGARAIDRLAQPGQRLGADDCQRPALVGEREAPVGAAEQRNPQVVLERPDLAAHRRLRDEAFLGRTREAKVPGRRLEGQQQVERRQSPGVWHALAECEGFRIIV